MKEKTSRERACACRHSTFGDDWVLGIHSSGKGDSQEARATNQMPPPLPLPPSTASPERILQVQRPILLIRRTLECLSFSESQDQECVLTLHTLCYIKLERKIQEAQTMLATAQQELALVSPRGGTGVGPGYGVPPSEISDRHSRTGSQPFYAPPLPPISFSPPGRSVERDVQREREQDQERRRRFAEEVREREEEAERLQALHAQAERRRKSLEMRELAESGMQHQESDRDRTPPSLSAWHLHQQGFSSEARAGVETARQLYSPAAAAAGSASSNVCLILQQEAVWVLPEGDVDMLLVCLSSVVQYGMDYRILRCCC